MENELKRVIEDIGFAFEDFKARNDGRLSQLEKNFEAIDRHLGKTGKIGGGSTRNDSASREHAKAFYNWMRKGNDDGLRNLEVQASLSTVSDPDGGYLVPVTIDTDVQGLLTDAVAMRRIATVKAGLKGDYKRPFSVGGTETGWIGENETRSETDASELKMFAPAWAECYAMPKCSQRLLDNSDFDVESWIMDEIYAAEIELEGTAFIEGETKPRGLLSYDTVANASWSWGNIGYIAGGNASAFTDADKLITLQHSLKPGYRRNGTWLMNDTTAETCRKLKDGEGRYLWGGGLLAGQPETLLGRPVEIDSNMPDIGADAYPIAFGDFKRAYLIGDHKAGRRLLRDPYTEKGQVLFYFTKLVFGGIYNFEAVKLLKIAES